MGAHEFWFSLRLLKNVWTKLWSDNPAGSDDLEEGDRHVIS